MRVWRSRLIHQSFDPAALVPPFHLYRCFLLIPKRSQSSTKLASFASIDATNFTRSFIGDVSFQGMAERLDAHAGHVTHVPGLICHLCSRFIQVDFH